MGCERRESPMTLCVLHLHAGPEYLSFAGFHPGAIQGMAGGHPHIHQPQMQQMLAGAVPNWPLAGFAVPSNVQARCFHISN